MNINVFEYTGKEIHYLPPTTGDPVWHLGTVPMKAHFWNQDSCNCIRTNKTTHAFDCFVDFLPTLHFLLVFLSFSFVWGVFFSSVSAGAVTKLIGDPWILGQMASHRVAGFAALRYCQEPCEHLLLSNPSLSEAKASFIEHYAAQALFLLVLNMLSKVELLN